MRTLRVLPALLFATASLLAVKIGDIAAQREMFAAAIGTAAAQQADAPEAGAGAEDTAEAETGGQSEVIPALEQGRSLDLSGPDAMPESERRILESLAERRDVLDARMRELDMRENLLKAAEERIETRIEELRSLEAAIGGAAEEEKAKRAAQIQGLVTMYETMRPKDAARIFDGLDLTILTQVVDAMKPQRMADILASMDAKAAQRLTTEIAMRGRDEENSGAAPVPAGFDNLPKIEGRPSQP